MGSRISSPAPILPTALDAQIRQRVAAIARYFRFGDLNNDIVVLEVAEFAQASPQRLDPISPSRNGAKGQEAHVPHLIALLRPRRERPRRRDAEQRPRSGSVEATDCGPAPCVICSWDRIVPSSER